MRRRGQENSYAKMATLNMQRLAMPLLILKLLSESPMCAYQIDREIEKRANGEFDASCLYTLDKLIRDGCVVKDTHTIEDNHSVIRPYYTITEDGRELLEMMKKEFKRATQAINTFIKSVEAQREKEK